MPKVRKPRRGRGGEDEPPAYPGWESKEWEAGAPPPPYGGRQYPRPVPRFPPPVYPPPHYPGDRKERESKDNSYAEAPPPPYHGEVDEKNWRYPGSNVQFPPPAYPSGPLEFHHGTYYNPGLEQAMPGLDDPFDEASDEERTLVERLHNIEQSAQFYASPPAGMPAAHAGRVLRALHNEHMVLTRQLDRLRAQGSQPAVRHGGGIANSHAKKTGALMRKHKISLGEASRRAAHSRNAKSAKAKKGKRRGGRSTRV